MSDFSELIASFGSWAWERHHNPLSWWIRPLFLIPYCYFAYRRSGLGVGITLVLLATSMFWFPPPDRVDPQIQGFLRAEKDYLFGQWNLVKAAIAFLAPLSLWALALAFWKRSLSWGAGVLVFMMAGKVSWSFYFGQGSGTAVLWPATIGLLACLAFVAILMRVVRKRNQRH